MALGQSEGTESRHGMWSNRWLFVLAAAGSAVGLGNIWKFPYIAGDNGGGAFVERGVGDVHRGESADLRLEFKESL